MPPMLTPYASQPFWMETCRLDYTWLFTLTDYYDLPPDNPTNDGFKFAAVVDGGINVINLTETEHWPRVIIWTLV